MDKLAINPTSPYTSANASQASLASGLQQQRGITSNGYRGPRYTGGPMSPMGSRSTRAGFTAGRVAPPILENPSSNVIYAESPTAGQAYAFPDPEAGGRRAESTYSRRNSFGSFSSASVFTSDTNHLPGQQGLSHDFDAWGSALILPLDLPDANIHHHSLQNKPLKGVLDEGDPGANTNTPYSRTPELRVTHKLAERKRRSEMKGCFDQLRARLPQNQSNKSSKWETLSRGKWSRNPSNPGCNHDDCRPL